MPTSLYIFGSVTIVSLLSFAGLFTISLKEELLRKYIFLLVSLAVGALLGDAIFHLLPEAFEAITDSTLVSLLIIAGIITFFLIEKFLHWHHHSHECSSCSPAGPLVLISDGVHNLIDGFLIGGSFLISIDLGLATTSAVILHEIPQEIGDFGVLIHSGYSRSQALFWNFISALFSVVGAGAMLLLGKWALDAVIWLIPFTAGGFIYIALSDLVPELNKTKAAKQSVMQFAAIAIGLFVMYLLLDL